MSLETATYIHQLNASNPSASDGLQQGDDHIRMIKAALKATFPNINAPVTVTDEFLNATILASLVPFGIITAFYGEVAPAGWAICNGQIVAKSDGTGNVTTPDLRDRVIAGVSASHAFGTTYGQESATVTTTVAGGHTHVMTETAAGAHDHGAATGGTVLAANMIPSHTHFTVARGSGSTSLSSILYTAQNTSVGGDKEYGLQGTTSTPDVAQTSASTGGSEAHTHSISAIANHVHLPVATDAVGHSHAATVSLLQPTGALHYIMKI